MEFYNKLRTILKTRPYTGVLAITDILRYNIKSLYIIGIDFYKGGYYKGYSNKNKLPINNSNIHYIPPQINLLKNIFLQNNNIFVDNNLNHILLEEYIKINKFNIQYKNDIIYKLNNNINNNNIFNNYYSKVLFTINKISKRDIANYDYIFTFNDKLENITNNNKIIMINYTKDDYNKYNNILLVNKNIENINNKTNIYLYSDNYYFNLLNILKQKFNILQLSINFFLIVILSTLFKDIYSDNIYFKNKEENLYYLYLKKNNKIKNI